MRSSAGVGLLMAAATASCSGAYPSGAGPEEAPSPPSREEVCDHLVSLFQQDLAKSARTAGDQQLDAARVP